MKNVLIEQLQTVMPQSMQIPQEIKLLYQYLEDNRLYIDRNGCRYGLLYPEEALKASWTETGRDGGTRITFYPGGTQHLKYWFNCADTTELEQRLCVFAQTGSEDSESAFWLNDQGELKIIHMGSGSGSMLSCVLADNAVDFLRLLAIGYDEICWGEDYPYPPNESPYTDRIIQPNIPFQNWVTQTFGVNIPKTALEIVQHPADMDDEESEDEFFNWIQKWT
ncbi:MAG: SMI1/KNR4 family protein [Lachnospiraceae bacterium]|nr:SMI1/KNR4 family protein [Lachnospiraceae bacterium]